MTCNCCLGMKLVNHKCLEKSLETNCPICCEFLFTSSEAVRALPCGHYMHSACFQVCKSLSLSLVKPKCTFIALNRNTCCFSGHFQAYTCSHYTCPICGKSLGDMAVRGSPLCSAERNLQIASLQI